MWTASLTFTKTWTKTTFLLRIPAKVIYETNHTENKNFIADINIGNSEISIGPDHLNFYSKRTPDKASSRKEAIKMLTSRNKSLDSYQYSKCIPTNTAFPNQIDWTTQNHSISNKIKRDQGHKENNNDTELYKWVGNRRRKYTIENHNSSQKNNMDKSSSRVHHKIYLMNDYSWEASKNQVSEARNSLDSIEFAKAKQSLISSRNKSQKTGIKIKRVKNLPISGHNANISVDMGELISMPFKEEYWQSTHTKQLKESKIKKSQSGSKGIVHSTSKVQNFTLDTRLSNELAPNIAYQNNQLIDFSLLPTAAVKSKPRTQLGWMGYSLPMCNSKHFQLWNHSI